VPVARPTDGVWASPGEDLLGVAVAPGVWATALPFPSPLGHSFSYLVESGSGVVVVDLGWGGDEGWQRFLTGLERAGRSLDDVVGVVVTHVHPDHYGLAPRIREHTGAWIAVHPGERPQLAVDAAAAQQRIQEMVEWLVRCGAPASEVEILSAESASLERDFPRLVPDLDLEDGVPVRDTNGSLVPVHTPGHTPGSTCFVDRGRGLVFTGDHVLPRVTPNVSKRPTSDVDPLGDFADSLHRLAPFEDGAELLVLPGHEWGFRPLGPRLAEIDAHHHVRLDEMEAAVRAGAGTVWEVAQVVPWARPFEGLSPRARRSAIGETYSHLHRLREAGRLGSSHGPPERWWPAGS
jgi:glyoxylase-like metal-dependent hydrolase (beta-lactamase superfamily II)